MTTQTPVWARLKVTMITLGASLWLPLQAQAATTGGDWRPTYDMVMMWVNFVILVALLIKLLRKPLGQFLQSQQDAIQKTLDGLENEKGRLKEEVQALRESVDTRKQKAEERHQRLMQRAKQERREIIETAREEAERRLAKARQLIDNRHREACQTLRNEIVDAAVTRVMADLPGHMTAELEQDLTDRFLTSINKPSS